MNSGHKTICKIVAIAGSVFSVVDAKSADLIASTPGFPYVGEVSLSDAGYVAYSHLSINNGGIHEVRLVDYSGQVPVSTIVAAHGMPAAGGPGLSVCGAPPVDDCNPSYYERPALMGLSGDGTQLLFASDLKYENKDEQICGASTALFMHSNGVTSLYEPGACVGSADLAGGVTLDRLRHRVGHQGEIVTELVRCGQGGYSTVLNSAGGCAQFDFGSFGVPWGDLTPCGGVFFGGNGEFTGAIKSRHAAVGAAMCLTTSKNVSGSVTDLVIGIDQNGSRFCIAEEGSAIGSDLVPDPIMDEIRFGSGRCDVGHLGDGLDFVFNLSLSGPAGTPDEAIFRYDLSTGLITTLVRDDVSYPGVGQISALTRPQIGRDCAGRSVVAFGDRSATSGGDDMGRILYKRVSGNPIEIVAVGDPAEGFVQGATIDLIYDYEINQSGEVVYFAAVDVPNSGLVGAVYIEQIGRCVCPADQNSSGEVDAADLDIVIANMGTAGPAGDVNGDGTVNFFDISDVLVEMGNVCLTPIGDPQPL